MTGRAADGQTTQTHGEEIRRLECYRSDGLVTGREKGT